MKYRMTGNRMTVRKGIPRLGKHRKAGQNNKIEWTKCQPEHAAIVGRKAGLCGDRASGGATAACE